MTTPLDEFEPAAEDHELARELVKDGWLSISNKYRHVARFTDAWPTADELIHPHFRGSSPGKEAAELWRRHSGYAIRTHAHDSHYVECRTLTPRQFRAFKQAGGRAA